MRKPLLMTGVAILCMCPVLPQAGAAVVYWVPNADGTWQTPANWTSNPSLPRSDDDVIIDVGGAVVRTITLSSGAHLIRSLFSQENVLLSGGSLTVSDTVQVNAAFTLNGGTLVGATVLPGSGGQPLICGNNTANRLIGVTCQANLDLSTSGSKVKIENGLTLYGVATINGLSEMVFNPAASQSLLGTGQVLLGLYSGWSGTLFVDGTQTLIIGPGITITGYGNVGGSRYVGGVDTLDNRGTIVAGAGHALTIRSDLLVNAGLLEGRDGGTLTVQPGSWSSSGTIRAANTGRVVLHNAWTNSGTMIVQGGTLEMRGTTTTAGLGSFSRTGGTVRLAGTLDNSAGPLDLDARGIGSLTLDGGVISGGVITSSGAALICANNTGNKLIGTTVNCPLDLSASGSKLQIEGGLTLNGIATVTGLSEVVFNPAAAQTLAGNGTMVFNMGSSGQTPLFGVDGNQTLTIGPGVTVSGQVNFGGSRYVTGTDTIINQGTIRAGSGSVLSVRGDIFSNQGLCEGRDGGNLTLQSPVWTSSGTIQALSTASVTLANSWSSSGTIVVNNATVNLGGNMTTAGLGQFSRTGGTIRLTGTLDNSTGPLDLNGRGIGSLTLDGGVISGGVITGSGAALICANNTGNKLIGTTVNCPLDMAAPGSKLRVEGGLTLNGTATITGISEIVFNPAAAQSLQGSGAIVFNWSGGHSPALYVDGNQTLTVGANLTLRGYGSIGGSRHVSGTDTIINQGVLRAEAGQSLSLRPDILHNQGSIQAAGGGTVTIANGTAFTNSGEISVGSGSSVGFSGGTIPLAGTAVLSGSGTVSAHVSNGGTVRPGGAAIGTLTIGGNFSQSSAGRLEIQLDTPASRDRLVVSGNLNLGGAYQGGTLKVTFVGPPPVDGNSYDVLDFASCTGSFSVLDLPSLPAGLGWDVSQLYTTGVIRVSASVTTLTVSGWSSRRTQGSAGPLAQPLDPSKTDADGGSSGPVSEARRHGILQIVLTFSGPVEAVDGSVGTNDVTVTDSLGQTHVPESVNLTAGDTELGVMFAPGALPNGRRYTLSIAGRFKARGASTPLIGDVDCQVRALVGDVNSSGEVSMLDVVAIRNENRRPLTPTNCLHDVNADGSINVIDMVLTLSHLGQTAP